MRSTIRITLTALLILAVSLGMIGLTSAAFGGTGGKSVGGKSSFGGFSNNFGKTTSIKAFGTSDARASNIFGSTANSLAVSKEKSGKSFNGMNTVWFPTTKTSQIKAFGESEAKASPIFGSIAESEAVSKEKSGKSFNGLDSVWFPSTKTSQIKAFGESEAKASPIFGSSAESTALSKETFGNFFNPVVAIPV